VKISFKSVHNGKSWQSKSWLITQKLITICLKKYLQKYQKMKDSRSHYIYETGVEKKFEGKKKKLIKQKIKTSVNLYTLSWQPVSNKSLGIILNLHFDTHKQT